MFRTAVGLQGNQTLVWILLLQSEDFLSPTEFQDYFLKEIQVTSWKGVLCVCVCVCVDIWLAFSVWTSRKIASSALNYIQMALELALISMSHHSQTQNITADGSLQLLLHKW